MINHPLLFIGGVFINFIGHSLPRHFSAYFPERERAENQHQNYD
jgi:hypothetical protein